MLSQAVPPIVSRPDINNLDSQSTVPPLSTLPHWTRVNTLARTCPPKPLLRDRLQRLPNTSMSSSAGVRVADSDASLDAGVSALDELEIRSSASDSSTGRRAFYLEHCIAFLKQEHSEILSALHEEVDRLKRDNRDLQFRLTLAEDRSLPDLASSQHFTSSRPRPLGSAEKKLSKSSDSADDVLERKEAKKHSAQRPGSRARAEELKDRSLEAELLDLRQALKDEKHRNLLLEEQLDRARSAGARGAVSASAVGGIELQQQQSAGSRQHFAPRPPAQPRNSADRSRRASATQLNVSTVDIPAGNSQSAAGNLGGLSVVHKPLNVSPVESASSLASLNTVDECKEFIRRLELENSRQADELHRLKQDLHEALYSHKWTPDAFLLAKAYLATDSDLAAGPHQSQRVPLRPNLKKVPDAHDSLSLPRVKLAFGTKALDRSKRLQPQQQQQQQQQLLTRTRLDRDLLSSQDASDGH